MTMKHLRTLLILPVCLLLTGASPFLKVIARKNVAGGGPTPVWNTSDFSTEADGALGNDANWVTVLDTGDGTPELTVGSDQLNVVVNSTADRFDSFGAVYQTAANGVDQCAIMQVVDGTETTAVNGTSFLFRSNAAASSAAYRLGVVLHSDGNSDVKWETYTGLSFTGAIDNTQTISSMANGDWLAGAIIGTGASTIAYLWDWGGTATSTDAWDGVVGAGSNWGSPTVTITTDPGANAVDSGDYIGMQFYATSSTFTWIVDNFYAGDIDD